MSKTNIRHFISSSFLVVGLGLFMLGSRDAGLVTASLQSGQGTTFMEAAGVPSSDAAFQPAFTTALLQVGASVSAMQMIVGMLVILLGLGMHALLYSLNQRTHIKN